MSKKEHYVYALIDPRTNEYFYIGKGKGKRYLSHLKKDKKRDFNYTKIDRIKEIQNSSYDVKIEILFPYLDEDTAFELEKILIYKLGRIVLSEGILTNMIPGGKWKPKDSVFYSNTFSDDFDLTKLDFVAQEKFLSINKISDFNYLNTNNEKQIIYKYDFDGNLDIIESLNCFMLDGFSENGIQLLKVIRENDFPIYLRSIYSKYFIDKIYVSKKIPYADFDIVDEQFNIDFDNLYKQKNSFELDFKHNGILRMSVKKERKKIELTSYYPSGKKKSYRKTKKKLPFGTWCDWYENGNLKLKIVFKKGQSGSSRTTYFANGQKYIETSNLEKNKTYNRWFENGKKEVEIIEDLGYVYYDELGNRIRVEPIHNRTSYKENELSLDFSEKKELSEEMKKEKEQAENDWLKYENEVNKTNEQ